jgi:hypothetical protein
VDNIFNNIPPYKASTRGPHCIKYAPIEIESEKHAKRPKATKFCKYFDSACGQSTKYVLSLANALTQFEETVILAQSHVDETIEFVSFIVHFFVVLLLQSDQDQDQPKRSIL